MDEAKQTPEQLPMFPDVRPLANDTYVPDTRIPTERDRENLNWRDDHEADDAD